MRYGLAFWLTRLAEAMRWRGLSGVLAMLRYAALDRIGPAGRLYTVWDPLIGTAALRARSADLHVFAQVIVAGQYDLPGEHGARLRARYEACLAAGQRPVILDGGANIGLFARLAATRFPQARILAVEPHPANFAMIRHTCAGLAAVEPVAAALWDREGSLALGNPGASSWAYSYGEAQAPAATDARAVTIDALLGPDPGGPLILLKLDIEGAEARVLDPSAAFWRDRPVVMVEPHDWMRAGSASLRGILGRADYAGSDMLVLGETIAFLPPDAG